MARRYDNKNKDLMLGEWIKLEVGTIDGIKFDGNGGYEFLRPHNYARIRVKFSGKQMILIMNWPERISVHG